MREINQSQDAIDHRVAKRNERINTPKHNAIDQLLKEDLHALSSLKVGRRKTEGGDKINARELNSLHSS
jgi:hypothetical protein